MRRATSSMNAAERWREIGVECGQAPRKHVPGGRGIEIPREHDARAFGVGQDAVLRELEQGVDQRDAKQHVRTVPTRRDALQVAGHDPRVDAFAEPLGVPE